MRIVVVSCDRYSDLWEPWWKLFKKFWPDCPWPVTLVTDYAEKVNRFRRYKFSDVRTMRPGPASADEWGSILREALSEMTDEKILLVQEDFLLSGRVDNEVVRCAIERNDANCIRLMPCPGPDFAYSRFFGRIADDAPYRVSCQAAVWDRLHLIGLLKDVTSPADFELKPGRDTGGYYLSVYRENYWPFPYINSAISRGEWDPNALKLCSENGIKVKIRRPVQGL